MRSTRRFFFVLLACTSILVSACSDGGSPEAGEPIVPRWHLVEELRLGSLDADGPEAFGNFIALEATADGTLFVADEQHSQIRVFDHEGHHLRSIGGAGSGPGEFRGLIGLAYDSSGRLWTADFGNRRFTIFDSDLRYVETQPYGGFRYLPWPGRVDRSGALHDLIFLLSPVGPRLAYVRIAGTSQDTLPLPRYEVEQREVRAEDGRETVVNVPYSVRPHWSLDDEGELWFAMNNDYTIHRIRYSGDTITTIRRTVAPVPLTSEERVGAVERLADPSGTNVRHDPASLPDYRPVIEGLSVDDRGRLWVRVPRRTSGTGYDVLSKSGRIVAEVDLPEGIQPDSPPVVRGNFLFLAVRNELDVPYVIRFRIAED